MAFASPATWNPRASWLDYSKAGLSALPPTLGRWLFGSSAMRPLTSSLYRLQVVTVLRRGIGSHGAGFITPSIGGGVVLEDRRVVLHPPAQRWYHRPCFCAGISQMSSRFSQPEIVILGAGPTGLGAAHRLAELGLTRFRVYEANSYVGGLAASFVDNCGFTWDIGGHVQFSHYEYFTKLMDELLAEEWLFHEREAWIWVLGRFVPYPFQNNIHYLPRTEMQECLRGLIRARLEGPSARPSNFREWIRASFGEGIARVFMLPYNFKVWAYPPEELSCGWVGERVAAVDLERVIFNILDQRPDATWGPNNRFRYPLRGGTGEIWRRLALRLPGGCLMLNKPVVAVDTRRREVRFADGSADRYEVLISTIPLDRLILCSDLESLHPLARSLRYSTVHVVGLGLNGRPPETLKSKCWLYFPDESVPFYRATVFSNYSPHNVPDSSRQWSLMLEVSESPAKPVQRGALVGEVIEALRMLTFLENAVEICSVWHHVAERAYPTPFLGRDEVLGTLNAALEERQVYSRGRFGAWKYEVGNQDHSLMQGVEVVNRILFGTPEITVNYPGIVNRTVR